MLQLITFASFILVLIPAAVVGEQFWLTVSLEEIEWREGCLTTSLCSQPRFQILEDLLPIGERVSSNWPVSKDLLKTVRPFTSYWPSGRLDDISLSGQVVGTDRTYGFPRICDQTPSVRVFREIDDNVEVVKLQAKCFNATMKVTKHTERCPWCPEPSEITVVGHEEPVKDFLLADDDRFIHVGIIVLAMISVLSSAAFALVLVLYLRSKRVRQIEVKPRIFADFNETKYNTPWDQQCKPLTFWTPKSDSGIVSPNDSSFASSGTPVPPSIDVLRNLTPPTSRYLDV